MVRILFAHGEALPEADVMYSALLHGWREQARERYGKRSAKAEKAGLLGLLMLGLSCDTGNLHFGENGRPCLENEAVDFNFSHTDTATFLAISTGDPVGLDAESGTRLNGESMERIVCRWFSEAEQALMKKDFSKTAFLRVWTGKEAMVKRTGDGLKALHGADTLSLSHGVRLWTFDVENTVVTLCAQADEEILAPICVDAELMALLKH